MTMTVDLMHWMCYYWPSLWL